MSAVDHRFLFLSSVYTFICPVVCLGFWIGQFRFKFPNFNLFTFNQARDAVSQWLSTFLMLRPFSAVPPVTVIPNHTTLFVATS